jgi:NAD(P)H-dependent FMN reductase
VGAHGRRLRRLRDRHPGVQPQHVGGPEDALDYLFTEWNNKAVGFVSYGGAGGTRAVEHLRQIAGELMMADVRQQVMISLLTEFEDFRTFRPGDWQEPALHTLLDQVTAWSEALAPLRAAAGRAA